MWHLVDSTNTTTVRCRTCLSILSHVCAWNTKIGPMGMFVHQQDHLRWGFQLIWSVGVLNIMIISVYAGIARMPSICVLSGYPLLISKPPSFLFQYHRRRRRLAGRHTLILDPERLKKKTYCYATELESSLALSQKSTKKSPRCSPGKVRRIETTLLRLQKARYVRGNLKKPDFEVLFFPAPYVALPFHFSWD